MARTSARRRSFHPRLEILEGREVPSCTVTVGPADTLSIDCDAATDTVVLYDDGAGGITGFATDNTNLVNINAAGISNIFVDTRAGDDRFAYFLTSDLQAGQQRVLNVAMQEGNDFFAVNLYNPVTGVGSKIQNGASLIMGAFGGIGNDAMRIDASRDVDIGVGGRLKMVLFGEDGNDLLDVRYHGTNNGAMSCRDADGGAGNDIIRVRLHEDVGSTGLNGCLVHGGDGNDFIGVVLDTQSPPVVGSIIDGGAGTDTAFVSSTFVIPIVNIP